MTKEEIHNIYLHMSGKAEGIAEATGAADFPVLFAHAILEYAKRPWQGLTDDEIHRTTILMGFNPEWKTEIGMVHAIVRNLEAKLKEKNT